MSGFRETAAAATELWSALGKVVDELTKYEYQLTEDFYAASAYAEYCSHNGLSNTSFDDLGYGRFYLSLVKFDAGDNIFDYLSCVIVPNRNLPRSETEESIANCRVVRIQLPRDAVDEFKRFVNCMDWRNKEYEPSHVGLGEFVQGGFNLSMLAPFDASPIPGGQNGLNRPVGRRPASVGAAATA